MPRRKVMRTRMIWSAAKKKIEASATITNTMMVVIVVSRRVGQVTLAASERTSCRNLNGLKAILSIRVRRETMVECEGNPNSRYRLSPRWKDEPEKTSSIVRGNSLPRRISAYDGPAAGGGYLLPDRRRVKDDRSLRQTQRPPSRSISSCEAGQVKSPNRALSG